MLEVVSVRREDAHIVTYELDPAKFKRLLEPCEISDPFSRVYFRVPYKQENVLYMARVSVGVFDFNCSSLFYF